VEKEKGAHLSSLNGTLPEMGSYGFCLNCFFFLFNIMVENLDLLKEFAFTYKLSRAHSLGNDFIKKLLVFY
jgi:hypothetical protein